MMSSYLRYLTIYFLIIFAIILFYNGSCCAENKVSIVSPQNSEEVKSYVVVKGTVQITDNSFVWVLAHRKDLTNEWWPQDEPKISGGQWTAFVNIGIKKDIGHDFEIAVATFGQEVKKTIDEYFEVGEKFDRWPPMPFPSTTSNVDIITVKKISH